MVGFPHSDIHGSKLVRSSPWLFAAYHVLHRLSTPRHPPCALRPVIIPTRHRRIGTSLSQACSCLTVRVHSNKVEVSSRTSHLRVHDLPSWLIQIFRPRGPNSAWGSRSRPADRLESCSCQRATGCPLPASGMPLGPLRRRQRGEPRSLAEPQHLSMWLETCVLFFLLFSQRSSRT